MNEWFTSAELAGLPGLPGTRRGVLKKACAESWQSRKRAGRGGGQEYHISSLPPETRAALAARHTRSDVRAEVRAIAAKVMPAAKPLPEAGLAMAARLTGSAKARMEHKIAFLALLHAFRSRARLSDGKARHQFVALWNAGEIEAEPELREAIPSVDPSTVYRWQKAAREDGAACLGGRYGNRKGTGVIDTTPDLKTFCMAFMADFPHAGPGKLHEAIGVRFQAVMISERAVGRWMAAYKQQHAFGLTAATNPDAWKDRYMPAFGDASEGVDGLNEVWELDSTPADILLADGHRYHLMGVIDVWSRRVRLYLGHTSTSAGIAHLLRTTLVADGVTRAIHTDNGKDYTSRAMTLLCASLGIEQILCAPFAAWEKPHIERFFRSFSHDLVELLPGYIGHNVADREIIRDRHSFADRLFKKGETVELGITREEFEAFIADWLTAYHARQHSALDGLSPNLKYAQWTGPIRRIEDARALDVLLMEAGVRTVGKKGIRLDNCLYIAPELAGVVGREVMVRMDPEDAGKVLVFLDGEFLCEAFDPDITGVSRREVAHAAKAVSREAASEARRVYREAVRQHNTKTLAQDILAGRLEAAPNVAVFPKRSETHTTDAIEQAGQAARGGITTPIQPVSDNVIRMQQREALEAMSEEAPRVADDPRKVHAHWMRVEVRIAEGRYVSAEEREGLRIYRQTPTYRAMADMFEAFGLDADMFGG